MCVPVPLVQVIIGGGRMYMTPVGTKDPEYPRDLTTWGKRRDKRNLIDEWQSMKTGKVTDYSHLGLGVWQMKRKLHSYIVILALMSNKQNTV